TFVSGPLARGWSASLLGGGHWQQTTDVNGDAWADLAGYGRAVVRPRVFWDDGNGRTFFATTGFIRGPERRHPGGTSSDSHRPAVRGSVGDGPVRCWRARAVPVQGPV